MGSIQAAVKKLLNCGYISYEEIIDNGKYKKIYCITESGKLHFYEWINAPIEEQNPKIPELAKVYFMGFSDKKNRETSIQQHLMYLIEQYNVLATICDDVKNIDVLVAVGKEAKYIVDGAKEMKMDAIFYCQDNQEVINYLQNNLQSNDVVLLKGSNGMKLKDVVTKIEEKFS